MSKLTDKRDIHWFPGHMMKTLRMVDTERKNVDAAVILLDARAPKSSRNPDLEKALGIKPRVYVLTKKDLADSAATDQWLRQLRGEGHTALAVSGHSKQSIQPAKAAFANALREAVSKHKTGVLPARLTAIICGIPNVGKSSFINAMAGSVRAKTADKPGVTVGKQWVDVKGESLSLLDIPGLLPKRIPNPVVGANLAFIGSIPDDLFDNEDIAAVLLHETAWLPGSKVRGRYKLTEADVNLPAHELLAAVATRRGMLLPGAEPDMARVATAVLDDFRGGKLGPITLEWPKDAQKPGGKRADIVIPSDEAKSIREENTDDR